jgi:hypothetical protein
LIILSTREDKTDHVKVNFCNKLESVFDKFPNHMKMLLRITMPKQAGRIFLKHLEMKVQTK